MYRDSQDRQVATTQEPLITLHGFACLRVKEIASIGAFLDWGLDKDLLVPFREQPKPMRAGQQWVVYLDLDKRSDRLFASAKMGPVGFQKAMHEQYGQLSRRIVDLYPRSAYPEPQVYNQYTDISDWYLELVCTHYPAMLASEHHDVWVYNFRYDNLEAPWDQSFGACHASELGFVFDNPLEDIYAEGSDAERRQLTSEMQAYWGCFAHTGDPAGCDGVDPWPAFEAGGPGSHRRKLFDAPSSVEPMSDLELERLDFWVGLYGLDAPWY